MTEQEVIAKASRASEVLDNEVYQEMFTTLKENAVKAISKAPLKDTDLIVRLKLTLELLDQIEKTFDKSIRDGEYAKLQIEQGKKFGNRRI